MKIEPLAEANQIVEEIATSAGVPKTDVIKILKAIGLDKALTEAKMVAGTTGLGNLTLKDLRPGVKVGRVMVHV